MFEQPYVHKFLYFKLKWTTISKKKIHLTTQYKVQNIKLQSLAQAKFKETKLSYPEKINNSRSNTAKFSTFYQTQQTNPSQIETAFLKQNITFLQNKFTLK